MEIITKKDEDKIEKEENKNKEGKESKEDIIENKKEINEEENQLKKNNEKVEIKNNEIENNLKIENKKRAKINSPENKEKNEKEEKEDEEKKQDKDEEDDENNNIRYTKSDIELFPGFLDKKSINEALEHEEMKEFLETNRKGLRYINPFRRKSVYAKKKELEFSQKTKQEAIKELVTNLKAQYILFNIKDFIRKYQINANPFISRNLYKSIRIIRNTCLYIYGIVILFERPWFCYKSTTIPLPSSFTFIENCEKKVEFMNIPFLSNDSLRIVEIIQTIIITVTQIMKYKDEYNLKMTNTGAGKNYNIVQIILFVSLFLCLIDLIISLTIGKFPIINFIIRPFIYIYMIRRLRTNWTYMLTVLWKTKKAYAVLSTNMIIFSVIGYVLFKKDKGFFESFGESVLQLYILLSTCNFPDIMLEAMEFSKFAVIYFFIYISMNYFIILSYLKTLYTTKYYEVNKRDCFDIIRYVINNSYNKHIFFGKNFYHFLLKQKRIYKLNNDEFNNFLILFNLYDKNSDTFTELLKMVEITPEMRMVAETKYGIYILKSKRFEILVNLFCLISLPTLFSKNIVLLIFHFLISICFIFEPIILIKHLGFRRFFVHHFNRVVFHSFNFAILICTIYLFWLDFNNQQKNYIFNYDFRILRIFISLRTIRIFVFLDKFEIIRNIYIIIRVSKEMLFRNLLLLYSFILLFSTMSILLTGGNIKKNTFDDENDPIPKDYVYINFNDFGSSLISCFCLIMINNLNILVKSLTYQVKHKMFFQFYFATFYFFSTLIIINIIQTLLLELYLISDHSLSDNLLKKKKEEEKQKQIKIADLLNDDFDDGYKEIKDEEKKEENI